MKKEELLSKWSDYKISAKEEVKKGIEGRYWMLRQIVPIIEALVFWKFVAKTIPWDSKNLTPIAWMKRKEVLSAFCDSANPLVRLIAIIESLPTAVWRKILWKHNIDFMSYESFLRRISVRQMMAIADNYNDLYVAGSVPRVFSRWDRFLGKISIEKIFSEDFMHDERYCNKASWSYNLGSLDFGFNQYPKGIGSDERVVEISPLRFLSDKNHADDFVVNQETGGKYWWLYRTVRSDYVINSGKKVELKPQLCPGFWYTMIIHLLFWIVSPAMFTYTMTILVTKPFHAIPWWTIGTFGVPGIITPLWILAALVKYIFGDSFLGRHKEKMRMCAGVLGFAWLLYVAGFILIKTYEFLRHGFGPVWSIFVMIATLIYLGYKIYHRIEEYQWLKFSEYPLYFRIPLLFFAGALPIKYPEAAKKVATVAFMIIMQVLTWIVNFCMMAWDYFVALGPFAALIVLYVISAGLLMYFMTLDEKKQEKFLFYFERVVNYASYAAGAATLLFLFIVLRDNSKEIYFFFAGITAVVFAVQKMIAWSLKPTTKESRELAENLYHWGYSRERISSSLILKNEWLKSFDKEGKSNILYKVCCEVKEILGKDCVFEAMRALIPTMTKEILDTIKASKLFILTYPNKEDRLRIFKKLALGHGFDEAVVLTKEEKLKGDLLAREKARKWEKIKTVLRFIFYPFILVWLAIGKVWEFVSKVGELATTLYRLKYELFNKKCPYVTQKRVLKLVD